MHAFAQVKARGALVDLLPALGEPRLEREVLAEPDQRIEQEMRELQRGARELLMRVERGGVGVIGHAQRLGARRLERGKGEQSNERDDEKGTHGRPMSPEMRASRPLPFASAVSALYSLAAHQGGPALGRQNNVQGFFVTGTDTDVGKTVVSAWLVTQLDACYWKPVQAGNQPETDSDIVRRLAEAAADRILPEAYVLPEPIAPHEAARRAGIAIDMQKLVPPCDRRTLVVEGAGGLMVPLTDKAYVIDLADELDLPVILVTRSTLGTINHTLLSLEAIRRRGLPLAGVVINGPETPHNRAAIERYGQVEIIAEIPWLDR